MRQTLYVGTLRPGPILSIHAQLKIHHVPNLGAPGQVAELGNMQEHIPFLSGNLDETKSPVVIPAHQASFQLLSLKIHSIYYLLRFGGRSVQLPSAASAARPMLSFRVGWG